MQKKNDGRVPDRLFAALLALAYLLAGLLWVAFSDEAGSLLFSSSRALTRYQTLKGAGFIAVTALLVFLLAARRTRDGEAAPLPAGSGASLQSLLTGLVLVTAAPLLLLLGYNLLRQTSGRVEEASVLVQGVARGTVVQVEAFLEEHVRLAEMIARRPLVRAARSDHCDPLLADAGVLHEELRNVVVLDAQGAPVCKGRPGPHIAVAAAELAGRTQGLLSPPLALPDGPTLALTVPVPAPEPGSTGGSVQLLLAGSALERLLHNEVGAGVSSALVTMQGDVLGRRPEVPGLVGRRMSSLARFAEVAASGGDSLVTSGIDGVERFYAVRRVANSDLLAIAGVDVDRTFGPVRAGALRSLGLVAVVVLSASLLITALVRRISSPMRALAQAADAVATGQFDRRAPEGGPRELARVARQFNDMLDRLPALERELRASELRHRSLLEKLSHNIPGMIFQLRVEPDGHTSLPFASDAIVRMFEVGPEAARMDASRLFERVHPEDLPRVLRQMDAGRQQLTPVALECRVVLPAGGLRHYLTYSLPERVAGGELWHGCTVDVTTLKLTQMALRQANELLEARVAERTSALAAANESLESFAFSVAHDLRAPLQAVEGFALALPALVARDPARVERLVQRIAANTAQMGRMIEGLLTVARAGKGELADEPVAQDALVREVLADLQVPQATQLSIAPLPVVRADPASLRQVWWNLLANAVKFTGRTPGARIAVGCERTATELVFFVRDNGAGFDPQFAGRLFNAFQRLHEADEFEGSGIGLALARRVVERHGGRIRAEGQPDAGATFWFTLPVSRAL